jgi:hypothetical protein
MAATGDLLLDQSEIRIACGGHVCKWIGTKWALFIDAFYQVSVHFKNFLNQPIRNKSHLWWPCL